MGNDVILRLRTLIRRQYGHVTRPQLLAAGLKPHTVDRWIREGRLIPVYRGVYAVGHMPTFGVARAAAAVLACGPAAALSHSSAASLWGFRQDWRTQLEVTAPTRRRRRGIASHGCSLSAKDVWTHRSIRVTSPARTALDIAPTLTPRGRARLVNDQRRAKVLKLHHLADVLGRYPLHPGTKLLRPFVEDPPTNATRSGLEDDFQSFCRRFGLPIPDVNVDLHGYEVDVFFREERLIVEIDGYDFHSDKDTFERDRERDAAMLAIGIPTVRVTGDRLNDAPEREADRLKAILARRRR